MDSFQKLCCMHKVTTEPDENGYGLCLKCGGLLPLRFTKHIFDKAMNDLLKSGGR